MSGDEVLDELNLLARAAARARGDALFPALAQYIAKATNASESLISQVVDHAHVRTLAVFAHGAPEPNYDYELDGTPCAAVLNGEIVHHESGLADKFPLTSQGYQGYYGVPLIAADGTVLGHLCVYDASALPLTQRQRLFCDIFAGRAAAELQRLHAETELRASQERFQDLFDEAPIAYVHEGLDSRFIRANKTAMRVLGITPADVPHMVGQEMAPKTPEAQARMKQAFDSVGKGADTSGVVLELLRHNDKRQIFIQWWSRPDPTGTFTRTMFVDITERVLMEREQAKLQAQNRYLQEEIKSVHNFDEIIGASPGLVRVLENVSRVAPTDATVLIWGETGTGKELVARAIHSASRRADKPFIKLNCAALPQGLVESELFGHEKGAFSGALARREGRFELANGGTIFLDEIGELKLETQAKLLRVLQEQEFERVGSSTTIKVDVRVVAATNRDLRKAVRDGEFREDLYYRLNVFPVELPPLRARAEDVPLLVQFFVQKYAPRVGRRIDGVDPDTLVAFTRYPWPGNIRELENLVERALILNTSPMLKIPPEMLAMHPMDEQRGRAEATAPRLAPVAGIAPESSSEAGDAASTGLHHVQREHILRVLNATQWVIEGSAGAALKLGMKPATLRHRMKKLGIARATAGAPS
ncbi:MAG: sigma 54-interacting transcriptional regulator [Pseudomonadota bacterium]